MRFQQKIQHTLFALISVILGLQMTSGLSFAGTIGLPIAFGQGKGFTSIRLDYERLSPDIESSQRAFQGKAREERILLSTGYAPSRFLELSLKLGLSSYETPSRKFNGSLGPAYGFGGKWTFYQKQSLSVGIGFSAVEFITEDGSSATSKLKWDEVEAFIGGALGGFEQMTPYFGFLFSKGRGVFSNGPTVNQKDLVDLFIGAAFRISDRIDLLSEARLIRENALSLSLSVRL